MSDDLTGSLNPDLDGQPCCVHMCFDVADTIAMARVRLDPLVGALDEQLDLALPICAEHQHLLRMGVVEFAVET